MKMRHILIFYQVTLHRRRSINPVQYEECRSEKIVRRWA